MATRRSFYEEDDRLLDAADLAAHLAITRKALYNARRRGLLPPPILIGSRLRWKRSDVESWLDSCRDTNEAAQ